MPIEPAIDSHTFSIWIAAAIGVTDTTGTNYQLTDTYGVTYTGAPAHLALLALLRRDLSTRKPHYHLGVERTAGTLIDWFTSPHTDPQHAAEFAALPPMRVCELVAYLYLHGHKLLDKVGPESLRLYTDHLLHHQVPNTDYPMPALIDSTPRSLTGLDDHFGSRLQITATAADGADEVVVPMEIHASENIYWDFTAAIPVPVADLNDLLLNLDIGDYLADNRELLERHLSYRDSHTEQGLHVEARLAGPGAALDAPDEPVEVELFFVGADRTAALRTRPFGSRGMAAQYAGAADQIFSVGVEIDAGAVCVAPTTAP